MKEIITGTFATVSTKVDETNTAKSAKSGSLNVFATPFMIALMEEATCKAVSQFLENDETTVGTNINVAHSKASGLGENITAKATIAEVDGRRITFDVSATDESENVIGSGKIERFVVNSEKFMKKVESKWNSNQ